jgi:DNA-binding response OmpR family regulator
MGLSTSTSLRTVALIVNEDEEEREAYADNLNRNGIRAVAAEDGLHGIAKAALLLPDIIAVNLGRRGGDVFDMCVRLKGHAATRHIPIIAVTEIGTTREIDHAVRAGCVSVLVKPCRPHVLLLEIRRILALHQPAAS